MEVLAHLPRSENGRISNKISKSRIQENNEIRRQKISDQIGREIMEIDWDVIRKQET